MKGSVLDSEATVSVRSWSINFSASEKLLLKRHDAFCLLLHYNQQLCILLDVCESNPVNPKSSQWVILLNNKRKISETIPYMPLKVAPFTNLLLKR